MMIQSIGTGQVSGTSLNGAEGISASPTDQAAAAMTALSSRVAATVLGELNLAGSGAKPGQAGGRAGDRYGVGATAEQLSAALGGTPADTGRLARALGDFTGEVAVLLSARPVSGTLGIVSTVHFDLTDADGRMGATDADHAVAAIDAAIFRLRENPFDVSPAL